MKLSDIKPNPNNPRLIKDESFKKLVKSVREFPEMLDARPLVLNKDNVILGGNMRYKAAKEAGLKDIPVKIVDWSEEKQREFIIKDNVSGGEWDWDLIANEWDTQELDDWGLDIPADLEPETEVEEDEAPEVSAEPPVSKLGEIYQLGKHRVLCGDSTDKASVELLMNGDKADMLLTDPPYGIGISSNPVRQKHEKSNWDDEPITKEQVNRLLDMAQESVIWGGNYFELPPSKGFVIWDKKQPENFSLAMCEMAWSSIDKPAKIYSESVTSYSKEHPTQKPVGLMAWCMKIYNSGEKIIDPYLGSGSTLIACEQTDRTCYGMELDPKYVDVIRKRYAKYTNPNEWEESWEQLTPAINSES